VRLADKLDVNLMDAAREKIQKNALKYPADKARGSAKKYSEL
jgi:dCTP diphosphatase